MTQKVFDQKEPLLIPSQPIRNKSIKRSESVDIFLLLRLKAQYFRQLSNG